MKKKILVVVLCIVMFFAGFTVAGFAWNPEVLKLEDKVEELEQTIADMNVHILDLNAEIVLHDVDMKKLEYLYGIDVEELLNE